jgi:hypothetical protein
MMDQDSLENVIAAGFTAVVLALAGTFAPNGPIFAVQALAAAVPVLALLGNRRERAPKAPEIPVTEGDQS